MVSENTGKADKRVEIIRKMQEELDRRTRVEKEAIRMIGNGEYQKANELIKGIDDGILKKIEKELYDAQLLENADKLDRRQRMKRQSRI